MSNKQMERMARENDLSAVNAQLAEEVADATAKGTVSTYQKIENAVVTGYKKIENGVVGGYKKIENGVVNGFGKVVDKCVEVMFAGKDETVEEAKERLQHKEEQ